MGLFEMAGGGLACTTPFLLLIFLTSTTSAFCHHRLMLNSSSATRIVVFSDLHYGEDPDKDAHTTQLQHAILAHHQPGLVVYDGDLISYSDRGRYINASRSCMGRGGPTTCWLEAIAPAIERRIPFVTVGGNHDIEIAADLSKYIAIEGTTAAGLSWSCEDSFSVVDIVAPGDTEGGAGGGAAVLLRLIGLNTVRQRTGWRRKLLNGNLYVQRGELDELEDFVAAEAVMAAATAAGGGRGSLPAAALPPTIAFVHIPMASMMRLNDIRGHWFEDVCCQHPDMWSPSRLDRILHDPRANVKLVISGHDHMNDFWGRDEQQLAFMYVRKTGFGGYSPQHFGLGARVLYVERRATNGNGVDVNSTDDVVFAAGETTVRTRIADATLGMELVQNALEPASYRLQRECCGTMDMRAIYWRACVGTLCGLLVILLALGVWLWWSWPKEGATLLKSDTTNVTPSSSMADGDRSGEEMNLFPTP